MRPLALRCDCEADPARAERCNALATAALAAAARRICYVSTDLVVGKVFVLLWPRQHFTWIHRPDTFADVPAPT